jgi:hypothetical protein
MPLGARLIARRVRARGEALRACDVQVLCFERQTIVNQ